MPSGNPTRLLTLAEREYRDILSTQPAPARTRRFKALRLNAARFDRPWDRKRGAVVRLMSVLLREDDSALERRVCQSDQTAKDYAGAAQLLRRESAHLRKVARLLDTAGDRLVTVLDRCRGTQDSV
jgi:hypothetical protein